MTLSTVPKGVQYCLNMNYVGKMISSWKFLYNEINAATLTGAIDVVVVEQPDGTYTCSPFHVRFGKMGVLRSKEKVVDIEINGEPVDIHMKLGESGEAFFVEEVKEDVFPPHMACSPIPPNSIEDLPPDQMIRLGDEDGGGGGAGGGGGGMEVIKEKTTDSEQLNLTSAPKTFKAEKVEELTILEGSVDFRPITGQNSSTSLSGMDTDFAKEDSLSADERQVSNNSNSTNTNNKRKRRKKSTKKKHQQQKRNSTSGGNFLVEESSAEAIFQLDDLDSPGPAPVVVPVTEVITELAESKPLDLPGVSLEGHDIHFFSDTEITPGSSPSNRCNFGPIQSDSEFETKRLTEGEERSGTDEASQSQWKWGELPTSASIEDNKPDSEKWMIQSMLGFMKKTKHIRHKSAETDGIYLSDFNSDDTEMAALYFPKSYRQTVQETITDYQEENREEDAESGNGPSLPQSPHSVEGAICGPKSTDFHQGKCYPEDIALSICGPNPTPEQFDEGLISYPEFVDNPNILGNLKLMVRFDGKYYPWKSAAPLLVSALIFNKPLPQASLMRLSEIEESEEQGKELKGKPSKKAYSWFNWSRNNPKYSSVEGTQLKEEIKTTEIVADEDITIKCEPAKRPDTIVPDGSTEQALDLPPLIQENIIRGSEEHLKEEEIGTPEFNSDKYRKSLRLTSEQISSLNLHPGANEIQFSVTTAYQGTTKCKCFLFCWRYDDKIVVSDIDGTITKSDVLGHILPIVGKDWAQSGVAKLFTKIKDNGYKLLYLSARAIGQSRTTRDYLKSIKQEELGLPEGPMLLNPTSLLTAFHTEVIEKKPEEFKISCLRDIQALFPSHIKPFYAGYGNKINDVWSYQAVGIPIVRIFTINHRGELKHELTETFQSSYIGQSNIVNELFPPILGKIETDCYRDERLDDDAVDITVEDILF